MNQKNIRIVLVHTTHAGNIGAAARAMKTMSLERLCLVAPADFPSAAATARASGAADILENVTITPTLAEAISDCQLVVGTSARSRRIPWPQQTPRESAPLILEQASHGEVAIVFGRERMGLTNEELDRCQHVISIPCNREYSSLNLAAAVQLIAYEIMQASLVTTTATAGSVSEPAADQQALQGFYAHLERVLTDLAFLDPANPRQLRRRLRRFFNRAQPTASEVNLLRGILTAVDKRGSNT